jgi:hypothetical protein
MRLPSQGRYGEQRGTKNTVRSILRPCTFVKKHPDFFPLIFIEKFLKRDFPNSEGPSSSVTKIFWIQKFPFKNSAG